MYKDSKSLKDIYKDKCNLHVTIHNLEKFRDHRVPPWGTKGAQYQLDQVNVPQQDITELFLKSGMMDPDLGMSKAGEKKGTSSSLLPQRGCTGISLINTF